MLKNGGINTTDWLLRIFDRHMETSVVPRDRKEACIVPIYKGKEIEVNAPIIDELVLSIPEKRIK